MRLLSIPITVALLAAAAASQVPDGWYVYSAFQSSIKGRTGLFLSHPRNPGAPTLITGLTGDLKWIPNFPSNQGASCVLRRPGDGALIVGERAPSGHSVDLHVITLHGTAVYSDAMFSVGVSVGQGEISQAAMLPNGDVLVAISALRNGPLAGAILGIISPKSGNITPVPVPNASTLPGIINAVAVNATAKNAYFGYWVASAKGDIYRVPLPAGGNAVKVASVPSGLSNFAFDTAGKLLVTGLGGTFKLFSVDVQTGKVTNIPQSNGTLNAIAVEKVTGNYAVISANAGIPPRSVFWMTPAGKHTMLVSPKFGTISGIDLNPDPEAFGPDTPGASSYAWSLAPNPGGLPTVGNQTFSLTERCSGTPAPGILVLSDRKLSTPITLIGAKVNIDPSRIVFSMRMPFKKVVTVPLPIPNDPSMRGYAIFGQVFHIESPSRLSASPGLELTIL